MEVRPILSAMRRNKVGAILIAIQMAVTLAILCNALFIIQQRLALSARPSGTDEANIFSINNQWVGNPENLPELVQTDLATLRALPGVVDAYVTNSYPLRGGGWGTGVSRHPNLDYRTIAHATLYFADEHTLSALGLRLIAGRNFNADEVGQYLADQNPHPAALIITQALAQQLFPGGSALGQMVYAGGQKQSSPIVGIVETLQVPWTSATGWGSNFSYSSILEPLRYTVQGSYYMVRAQPGQLAAVMRSTQRKLFEVNRGRVLDKVEPLTDTRVKAYRDDRGLAIILAVVCAVMVAVTAFGIVGLTSYWVAQRRRQIGIRRALGATRTAIVRYFQTENFLIAAAGAAIGVALAIAVNLWMVSSFAMPRLHTAYPIIGAVIVLLLGQCAVLWPALRAAAVPPALATRSV
jgi:putative ABC transport system permease protein